ncbi:MAG: hypothetical protein ABFE13_11910 [Phycisphaerales bacterium]
MTSWRTLVGSSETLCTADLDALGGQVTAVIESVNGAKFEEETKEDDGQGDKTVVKKVDKKALIAFKGKRLKFAANTINCLLIDKMFGEDIEGWPGHALTMMSDKVEVAGKFKGQPCIRVKGSPELTGPLTVAIKLPRRKAFNRTLVPTGPARNGAETGQNGDPGEDAAQAAFTGPDAGNGDF